MMVLSPAIQPLQLSLNFPDLSIAIDEVTVPVVLKKNGVIVLDELYVNGPTGSFTLKLKSLIHSLLTVPKPADNQLEEITDNYADFSLEISSEDALDFRVLKCGVDIDDYALEADYAYKFTSANFLTWQPAVKEVATLNRQYLTYYTTVRCELVYQVFPDETMYDILMDADTCYSINVGALDILDDVVTGVKVWVKNALSGLVLATQEYQLIEARSETTDAFLFEQSVGGVDTIECVGALTEADDHDVQRAMINDEMVEYAIDYKRVFKKNIGFITTEAERLWIRDFFGSLQKWHVKAGKLKSIYLKSWENETQSRELNEASFTYLYSKNDGTNLIAR